MVRHVIPQESLAHGVSQHPKKARSHLFCERQENCLSSPAIGLTKRPPTNHIAKVVDSTFLAERKTHVIDRSAEEQYLALFEHEGCRVLGIDGTEYPVHDVTAAGDFGYLGLQKRAAQADGSMGYVNLLTPEQAETLVPAHTLSNLTVVASGTIGPLGQGFWQELEVTSSPSTGLVQLEVIPQPIINQGTKIGTSVYVKEHPTNAAAQFKILTTSISGFTTTAVFDWTAGVPVFNSGASTAGTTSDVEGPLSDGSYRVLGARTTPIGAASGALFVQIIVDPAAGSKMYVWGVMLVVGDLTMVDYLDSVDALKATQVADYTMVTHSKTPLAMSALTADRSKTIAETFGQREFTSGVLSDVTDVLYVQMIQGVYDASYKISVGCTSAGPQEVHLETQTSASAGKTNNAADIEITQSSPGTWSFTTRYDPPGFGGTSVSTLTHSVTITDPNVTAFTIANALRLAHNNFRYPPVGTNAKAYPLPGSAVVVYVDPVADKATLRLITSKSYDAQAVLTGSGTSGAWTIVEHKLSGTNDVSDLRTEWLASSFATNFLDVSTVWNDHIQVEVIGSTIVFLTDESFDYFDVSDSEGDSLMQGVYKAVPSFDDLPVQAYPGTRIKVSLDAVENENNIGYFVEYTPDIDAIHDGVLGRWVESTDYNLANAFDATTFPHRLVPRIYDSVGHLWDGTAISPLGSPGALYWEWNEVDWENRLIGDAELAPTPGVMDPALNPAKTITQIAFTRGRLGFVGGTSVDMSESNRFFNLFRTTSRVLVDSDPFNIVASHPKMSVIDRVIPFAERLVLFSEKAQMLLSGDPFSARTVSLEPFVDFANEPLAAPQVHGNRMWIMFPKAQGEYLGLREVYPGTDGVFTSSDRTVQVPSYIPPNPRAFTSDSRGETFIYLSNSERGSIYIFKTLAEGENVIQSAWSKFTFASDDIIVGAHLLGKQLIMLTERAGKHHLETMDLAEGSSDPSSEYLMRLDRRVKGDTISSVYSTPNTVFTLPWDIPAGGTVAVRNLGGTKVEVVTTNTTTPGAHTVSLVGDLTAIDSTSSLWFGLTYRAEYEFTQVQPKERRGGQLTTITTGAVQILRGRFAYENTGHLTIAMKMTGRADVEVPFDSTAPDTPEDGTLEVSVLSPTEQSTVILRSDSPLPFTVLNTEWDADLIARGSRLRI